MISLVIDLLMKGAWLAIAFFFPKAHVSSEQRQQFFFKFFEVTVFPTRAELKKAFWRPLIKTSIKNILQHRY